MSPFVIANQVYGKHLHGHYLFSGDDLVPYNHHALMRLGTLIDTLERQIEEHICALPDHSQKAPNSGDGNYYP